MEDVSVIGWIGHSLSSAAILGTIFGFFPYFAALLAAVWYLIQIYESRTFQHWFRNRLMKHRAKRLAQLRAKEKIVVARIVALEKVRSASVEAREIIAVAKSDAAKIAVKTETDVKAILPPI
jgi:hypothetical protein